MIKKLFLRLKRMDKRIKFLMVGALNTLIGFLTEVAVYLLMGLPFSLNAKTAATTTQIFWATTANYAVGSVHSYLWNKFFTFESKQKSVGEVLKFLLVTAVQIAVNVGLKYLLVQLAGMNTYIAAALTLFVTTVLSYVGHSLFSFRGALKKEPENQTIAEEASSNENNEE